MVTPLKSSGSKERALPEKGRSRDKHATYKPDASALLACC